MNQTIIISAALALETYGFDALIGSHVVFVSEVLGNGETTLKTGIIIDDSLCFLDDEEWDDAALFVEVEENGEGQLHPIYAHEQIALLPTAKKPRICKVVRGAL